MGEYNPRSLSNRKCDHFRCESHRMPELAHIQMLCSPLSFNCFFIHPRRAYLFTRPAENKIHILHETTGFFLYLLYSMKTG
jgi:hypothetical protein